MEFHVLCEHCSTRFTAPGYRLEEEEACPGCGRVIPWSPAPKPRGKVDAPKFRVCPKCGLAVGADVGTCPSCQRLLGEVPAWHAVDEFDLAVEDDEEFNFVPIHIPAVEGVAESQAELTLSELESTTDAELAAFARDQGKTLKFFRGAGPEQEQETHSEGISRPKGSIVYEEGDGKPRVLLVFSCEYCGKPFKLRNLDLSGRKMMCNRCGEKMIVPTPAGSPKHA